MSKLIAPLALTVSLLAAAAIPALAQYDRYDYNRNPQHRYSGGGYSDQNDYNRSYQSRDYSGGYSRSASFRDPVLMRIDKLRARASDLVDSGHLSRSHFDQTMVRLDEVGRSVSRGRFIDSRLDSSGMKRLDEIQRDMHDWSKSDGRRSFHF